MCGIVGAVGKAAARHIDQIASMRDTMTHRGPDDAGLWCSSDHRVVFAHRRLSIIDLSLGGHQPMCDTTGTTVVTFNGEIYNFQELRRELSARGRVFRSESDTEVLIASYREWGTDFLTRLCGMFAFALYDIARHVLLLGRDRAGEKPLFVWPRPDGLLFASELKALMPSPEFERLIDPRSLDFYLTYGYVPEEACIFQGVQKLAPAHAMEYHVDTGQQRIWRYWNLPPNQNANGNAEEIVERIDALLLNAVRKQLVADVPLGILLSGGLDSSLVTAMAARVSSRPVKTFTVVFPGQGLYDEGPFARKVASHFGTEHHELIGESARPEIMFALARQYDEPIADSSMVPTYLLSRVIREHATVALGGDGGDELFGGYPHYSWICRAAMLRRVLPPAVRSAVSEIAQRLLPIGFRSRNHLVGLSGDIVNSIAHLNMYLDLKTRRSLFNGALNGAGPEQYRASLVEPQGSAVRGAMIADFQSYLPSDLLVKVDRASMLASLEVRAPMLDPELIEFAFAQIPDSLKATAHHRKIVLRMLAARLLPAGMDLERKQGFSIPLEIWFRGEWGAFMRDVLRGADSHLFDFRVIHELLDAQAKGYRNTQRLFALTMFELWRREYRASL